MVINSSSTTKYPSSVDIVKSPLASDMEVVSTEECEEEEEESLLSELEEDDFVEEEDPWDEDELEEEDELEAWLEVPLEELPPIVQPANKAALARMSRWAKCLDMVLASL